MRFLSLLAFFVCCAFGAPVANPNTSLYYTALDEYVARPDSHWNYTIYNDTVKGQYWTGTVLKMYSQQWLTPDLWNRGNASTSDALWWHWMLIVVPEKLDPKKSDHAFLWITGGNNDDSHKPTNPYSEDNEILATLCMDMGVVGAALYQVPNQPIYFPEDPSGKGRTEDAFIAWTWNHYIFHTNDSDWLARLPMTKSAVKAMDTVTDFFKTKQNITKFVVSGASKRGWTTWTTGLTDTRVVAIIPIVLDVLHVITSLHHMWRAYGGWSYVLKDYYQVNLTKHFDDAAFEWLCQIEDPFYYLPDPERFKMPKLVINAAGDEFLQNDNDQYWWDQMPGPKFRQMCQNAEHSEATAIPEIIENIGAWGNQYFLDKNWPKFNWTIDSTTGYITVWNDVTVNKPVNVTMWHAMSFEPDLKGLRDWRLESANGFQPVIWHPTALTETAPGSQTWVAKQNMPTKGWMGFFVEMMYIGPAPFYNQSEISRYRLTTQVSIIPKTKFPFDDCYGVDCYGTLV